MITHTLNAANLEVFDPATVAAPGYDLNAKTVGHAHIGPGVFHRGHQALYADDLLASGVTNSAICAISMRSGSLRRALTDQDGLYSVIGANPKLRIVGSIGEVVIAHDNINATVSRLCDPAIRVVTMTVTEAGYCWSADTESLDVSDPGMIHDIDHPNSPITMPGLLLAALDARRGDGTAPFDIVPCDNLLGNGTVTSRVLMELATRNRPHLVNWLESEVTTHSTMVDRMVPATVESDREESIRAGVIDKAPIRTEPFSQWVIETEEATSLPPWDQVGAEFVPSVERYERLKLQVLNATHSAIAYLGLNAGHSMIDAAASDATIFGKVTSMVSDEIGPAVARQIPNAAPIVARYAETTMDRFANPTLGYTTAKVASDGARKLQQRILPTVGELIAQGKPVTHVSEVIAAWMWTMWDGNSLRLGVRDKWFDDTVGASVDMTQEPQQFVATLISQRSVFGALSDSTALIEAVQSHIQRVWATGASRP